MGTFGNPSSYNNTGALGSATNPTTAQGLSRDRENQKAILELPGTQAWAEKTITDGVIIPTSAEIIVLPEGGASTDSLTTIALTSDGTTTLHEGMPIRLKAANSNTITVVHGTGTNNISTIDGNNVVLDTTWYLELKLINGVWVEQKERGYKIALEAQTDASTALARTAPATTTSRGIVMPDGTTIEIDVNGRISVPTATAVTAGLVRPDGTTITVDNGLISVSSQFISHRDVIQTSGAWTSNIRRVIRLTAVGAGGSGGNGGKSGLGGLGGLAGGNTSVTIPAGAILDGELLVSPRTITAAGGSAGGGGGQLGEGGGGEAGEYSEHIVVLPAGATLTYTIGGGGVPYSSGWSTTAVGTNGTGPNGGQGGVSWGGGRGAPGAGQGMCYINGHESGSCGTISPCGYGGQKHATYGGGGPGGVGQHTNIVPRTGAKPGPGATDAAIITANDSTYPRAGSGGDGAVIIEYY